VIDDVENGDMLPSEPAASSASAPSVPPSALPQQYRFEKEGPMDLTAASPQSVSSSISSSHHSVNWLSHQVEKCFSISVRTEDNPSMAKALRNWQRWSIPADTYGHAS
jgi:hypothetical protein